MPLAAPLAACIFAALNGVVSAFGAGQVALARRRGTDNPALGFVRGLEFRHRLRVCNAYPYAAALDVFRGRGERLTADVPMPYKACRDFVSPLKAGDKLEFKVGDASAGTFSVSDLPNNDAVLLLVIHRHDTLSTAVSFESHVFANLLNAQIAIIDTYKGAARALPRILDSETGANKNARTEELRYDSVVAVNPGLYKVQLVGQDGETKAQTDLVALNRESYVVLRMGVESQQGASYPQELVVYPMSDVNALPHSGTQARTVPATFVLLLATLAVLDWNWRSL